MDNTLQTYQVSQLNCGRVVLDKESHGVVTQSIKAPNYFESRLMVDEHKLWHEPGHGWYSAND